MSLRCITIVGNVTKTALSGPPPIISFSLQDAWLYLALSLANLKFRRMYAPRPVDASMTAFLDMPHE